jgi:hypothetical protein
MAMLKAITTTVGWLAGSLAAISAVLGGCGFIVVRSHSHLLGLGDFLQYSNNQYVIEGSQFFLYTIIVANETILRIGALALPAVGIPFFLLAKSRWWATIRTKWKDRLLPFMETHGWLFPLVTGIVLFSLFFFRLVPYMEDFKAPMGIGDLLVSATTTEKASDACEAESRISSDCMASSIVRGERIALEGYYFSLMLHYMEATLVLVLVWRLSLNWPHKTMVRLPFAAMFLAFTLLMPMCYGVLVKPAELSPLTLDMKNEPSAMLPGDLFILLKSDEAFIVWNHTQRKIVWYPAGSVASAVIGSRQPLFKPPPDAKEGSP